MADIGSVLGGLGVGGNIGKAIVQLELDTKKYAAEMKTAEVQTVSSTSKLGQGFSQFGGLAQTALLGVGVAAVAGLGASVNAAIEAQDAQNKLSNTLDNNAKLSDVTRDSFIQQADALRDLTGVDDEAIISAQALLGQFDLTGKEVQELIPRIVDLSSKMDIDLAAAAKAVGKATQGNTAGLQRYGIAIDEASGKGGEFTAVLKGLNSTVGGFAEQRAIDEPWRVLGAQFEEVSEKVGEALLPALRSLVETVGNLTPLLEKAASAIQFLPLVQMSENMDGAGNAFTRFADGVIDTIPILGHFVDISGDVQESAEGQVNIITRLASVFRQRYNSAIDSSGSKVKRFANMTKDELEKWAEDTKESFDTFVLGLEESAEVTRVTRDEFLQATRVMEREARQLARAMRDIAGEKWVNEEYIAFLSEQGPEWLIGFSKLTESEQRKAQNAWEDSTKKTDAAKRSLDRISGALEEIGRGKTQHTVQITYEYKGFDPSKPGMGGPQP